MATLMGGLLSLAFFLVLVVISLILSSIKIIYQYERGVLFTLGKYSGTMAPGLRFVVPVFQSWQRVDMRIRVVDVPPQETITKDNVSVKVNAVLYFKIANAADSVIKINQFMYATSQLAQTTMRNVVGEVTLDELIAKRDEVSKKIQVIVDKATDPWGIKIESVELKHMELPGDMKRVMAKGAEAERLKRAIIIRAQGDAEAAERVTEAAELLSQTEGALHLRTLQSLNDIASDPSNVVHFFIPLDVIKPYEGYKEKVKK